MKKFNRVSDKYFKIINRFVMWWICLLPDEIQFIGI